MAALSPRDTELLRESLQDATVKCSERCLYQSAKWAAELLDSLPASYLTSPSDTDPDSPMSAGQDFPRGPHALAARNSDGEDARLEASEFNRYLLARSYFECREYDRCAAVFLPQTLSHGASASPLMTSAGYAAKKGKAKDKETVVDRPNLSLSTEAARLSRKALFLALYAKFMAGEKRKDEESEMILGPADGGVTSNRELASISRSLELWFSERQASGEGGQGWLEYLYGIVFAKNHNKEDAKRWLIRSLHLYPFNWGAWQELSGLVGSVEEASLAHVSPELPMNIMTIFFHLYTNQELYQSSEEIRRQVTHLQNIFPTSLFLKTQRALLLYHSKDFEEAEAAFSDILRTDPYRLDSLDHYSNILFVMQNRPKLAFVAQLASATDKYRPETCCVVGNYYSLKSEHEKAVVYFRRALTLDRSFTLAWTLMGHEYVEMKNTHAAIESYRRAVDINRKDYRAWYGLGQTYEVLEMHLYALFYYQRAASLHPYDPKMWQAVASCYAKMGKAGQAIKCYKRALVAGSSWDSSNSSSFGSQEVVLEGPLDPEALYQIALMYEKLGDAGQAAHYMELTLAQEEGPEEDELPVGVVRPQGVGVTVTTSKARMWLARYEYGRSNMQRAMELANELCADGTDVEEAKALIRDIRARSEGVRG